MDEGQETGGEIYNSVRNVCGLGGGERNTYAKVVFGVWGIKWQKNRLQGGGIRDFGVLNFKICTFFAIFMSFLLLRNQQYVFLRRIFA
jgi:hypothetical protein